MSFAISTLLPRVLPFARGVADTAATRGLRDAAIEFCEKTKLWKYETTVAVLAATPESWGFTLPTDSALHEWETGLLDGAALDRKAADDLDHDVPGWRNGDLSTGMPRYVTQIEQGEFILVPAPYQDGTLSVRLRLKPSQTATTLPDFLTEYAEALGWGALARVLMIPGQPFTNPDLASVNEARWLNKLDSLRTKSAKGQHRAPIRMRPVFF